MELICSFWDYSFFFETLVIVFLAKHRSSTTDQAKTSFCLHLNVRQICCYYFGFSKTFVFLKTLLFVFSFDLIWQHYAGGYAYSLNGVDILLGSFPA